MIAGKAPQTVNSSEPNSVKRISIRTLDSRWGREDVGHDAVDRMHEAFSAYDEAA
jgi:hypothetical protein